MSISLVCHDFASASAYIKKLLQDDRDWFIIRLEARGWFCLVGLYIFQESAIQNIVYGNPDSNYAIRFPKS